MIENLLGELDSPGEFFHDKAAQKLYLPVLAAVNLWYVAVRLYFRGEAANSHKFALIGCAVVYALTYPTACEASTQPTDSLASYFFDVMALTMIAQFFGALTVVP